jgi:two-component system cell cycle response regulator
MPRILLVDDSPVMRKAATKMLSEEFDVITAIDGQEAWEKIEADASIQVVFTDLSMPRMDGYALLRKVRGAEDEGTLNLPVIVVTGAENDETARKKALDVGATDFITKPFSTIDLLARARAHANYRRMTKRLEAQITLDNLTGLANKSGFIDHLQQDIAFARRHAQPLSLVRIEIDDFKRIFLREGKLVAEKLIQHVAQLLRSRVRKEDTAARIGLAGFALALPAGQHEGSKGLIERLRAQFEMEPVNAGGTPIAMTISAAVCTLEPADGRGAYEALEACELVLQMALQSGGNRVLGNATNGTATSVTRTAAVPTAPPLAAAPAPSAAAAPAAAARAPANGINAATPAPAPATQTASRMPDAATPVAPAAALTSKPPAAAVKAALVPAASASQPAAATAPSTPTGAVPSLDAALQSIERGEGAALSPQLPALLKRLLPLLKLLSDRQRSQLVMYLQSLAG